MTWPNSALTERNRSTIRHVYRLSLHFYGKNMFFLRDAGPVRWFVYQQRLLFGRLLRAVRALFVAGFPSEAWPFLCETANHRLAWERAVAAGYDVGAPVTTPALSFRMARTLLFWDLLTIAVHPFVFAASLGHPRLAYVHERLLFVPRMKGMLAALEALRLRRLGVANDHMGQAFQLGAAAALNGVEVIYLQHGAVTPHFPRNGFARMLLWDSASAEIYASKTRGEIVVDPALKEGSAAVWKGPTDYALVALSIVYPLLETIRCLRSVVALRRPVVVRFHPSDKKAWMVMLACRCAGIDVLRDTPRRSFAQSFDESSLALVTTSSVLVEAAERAPDKVIWLRYLGDAADYYGLTGTLARIASSRDELSRLLEQMQPV